MGKSKAEVAAAFVEKRVRGVKITSYNGKIQDKDEEYYKQFHVIVCGLDSIEARRWINATLVDMVDPEDSESFKPFVDGGTEGRCRNTALEIHVILTSPLCRLQRPGKGHSTNHQFLHRMSTRHACASCCSTTLHFGDHTTTTSSLHRVGTHYRLGGTPER